LRLFSGGGHRAAKLSQSKTATGVSARQARLWASTLLLLRFLPSTTGSLDLDKLRGKRLTAAVGFHGGVRHPLRARRAKAVARVVASGLTTPLLPDDYLGMLNPLWSARELRGRVVSVQRETEQAATIVIRPGWGWRFTAKPGQYVGIGVQVEGRWHWRSYSLTSTPVEERGEISVTVKAMPEGFISTHLVDGLASGSVIRLARPRGDFVLPEPPPPRLLFLTAGSGITPVVSMLRTMDRRDDLPDVVLVASAKNEADLIFRHELRALAGRHPSLRLHEQFSAEQGRLDISDLDHICPDWRDRQTWACGPEGMLDDAEDRWRSEGLSARLHTERFAPKRVAGGEGGHITFTLSGKETDADGATTLLEAAEAVGVRMPYGCRMGLCYTCVVGLASGSVRDLRDGSEKSAGAEALRIQTCISVASDDCTLEV
jgi:ferredoxin-NADP reductase